MINTQDQEDLFKLIAEYLDREIVCTAIGGTAMMFAGYKTTTKDIDLVFKKTADRDTFIRAIKQIGYREAALGILYDKKRKKDKNRPLVYSRGEERFDLFVGSVFGFKIDFWQENITQRHDFLGRSEMTVFVLTKELLILLKTITGRDKDYEDIETIVKTEKIIDWDYIIETAIQQKRNNNWILIDLEEVLQRLKKITLIKKKYFDRLYKAENK